MKIKKEGFMLPIVMGLVAILASLGLVMNKLSESRMKALKNQEDSFYSSKTITMQLVGDEVLEVEKIIFFTGGLATYCQKNPPEEYGKITFDGGTRYKDYFKEKGRDNWEIPAKEVENLGWKSEPCIDKETGESGPCKLDEDSWKKEAKFELPEFEVSNNTSNLNINGQDLGEDKTYTFYEGDDLGNITLGGDPVIVQFKNDGITPYKIKSLIDNRGGNTIEMEPGDYWIEDFKLKNATDLRVKGEGTVRIYLKNAPSLESGNHINKNGKANNLLIVSWDKFEISQSSTFIGAGYAENQLWIHNGLQTAAKGAFKAGYILFNQWDTTFEYDSDIEGIDYGQTEDWMIYGCEQEGESDCWI